MRDTPSAGSGQALRLRAPAGSLRRICFAPLHTPWSIDTLMAVREGHSVQIGLGFQRQAAVGPILERAVIQADLITQLLQHHVSDGRPGTGTTVGDDLSAR